MMRIRDIKINGVAEPEGFNLEKMAVSWKADQTESTEQIKSRICLFERSMNPSVFGEKQQQRESASEKRVLC